MNTEEWENTDGQDELQKSVNLNMLGTFTLRPKSCI
jgi:hypothetical protein